MILLRSCMWGGRFILSSVWSNGGCLPANAFKKEVWTSPCSTGTEVNPLSSCQKADSCPIQTSSGSFQKLPGYLFYSWHFGILGEVPHCNNFRIHCSGTGSSHLLVLESFLVGLHDFLHWALAAWKVCYLMLSLLGWSPVLWSFSLCFASLWVPLHFLKGLFHV